MFMFDLDETHEFVDAASVIAGLSPIAVLKFSTELFSIMASALPPSPRCILALQIRPQFFRSYFCTPQRQYSRTSLDQFQFTMLEMERNGLSKLTFFSTKPDSACLIFNRPDSNGPSRLFELTMCPADGEMDMGGFDCTIFVSIVSQGFRNVVNAFSNSCDYVLVTLTASLVHFFNAAGEMLLTTERKQCIIGGVPPSCQIKFLISLNPSTSFYELARRSARVWLYKPRRSCYGIIVAPIGLYSRFLAYISE